MTARRLAGAAAVALFALLVARFWHPVYGLTALIQLDASNEATKIAAFRTYPVFVYRDTGGYDGMAYAQIAHHPGLRAPELAVAVDSLPYRARRILPPALAWALAGGRPEWITPVYAALNVAAWLILAAVLWRLLPVRDARALACWCGVLFSAGALASVRLALTDLTAALFLALLAWRAESPAGAAGGAWWGALAGLTRETSILGLAALWGPPWRRWRPALLAFAALTPLLLWLAYIRHVLGPTGAGYRNFAPPLTGFAAKWIASVADLVRMPDRALALTTLLALAGLTVQVVWLLRRRSPADPWWRLGAAFLPLFGVLGPSVWEDHPGAAFRTLLPLTLACNVLLARRAAPWLLIAAANLTVPAGLIAFRDRPFDRAELAAVRRGPHAAAAREGAGWYGEEHTWRHQWAWAGRGPAASVLVDSWGGPASLEASAFVRALAPGHLRVLANGREVWSGEVETRKTPLVFRFAAPDRRTELDFQFDRPPVVEGSGPDARALAFALYDLKLTFADAGAASH